MEQFRRTENKFKKIVIIGNPDSIWIKKYTEKILLPENKYRVWIVDVGIRKEGTFLDFFRSNHIDILRVPKSKIHKIPFIGAFVYAHKVAHEIKNNIAPDIIHAHYVTWNSLCIVAILKNRRNVTVASYWGSDILRENKWKLLLCKLWIRKIDRITLTTAEMRRAFSRAYGGKYKDRIHSPFFGVNGYDALDSMPNNSDIYKERYGANEKDTIITVGYNGANAQQHIKALEAINRLSEEKKKNIFIIVPMTYGVANPLYIREVENYLLNMNISGYKVLLDYMNDKESSKLKCVTDIFVHAQTTDAFSASIQEFLYAEKIVLNPSWIKYDEHEERGVFFLKYDTFEDLSKLLEDGLTYLFNGALDDKLRNNRKILQGATSWETVAPEWRKLYL